MKYGKIALVVVACTALTSAFSPVAALAQSDAPYVSLGADLTRGQEADVLDLLDVSQEELTEDNIVYVTNEDEHRYLGGAVASSLIGEKALSSCKVVRKDKGHGITVNTQNVTYVTADMFKNALATAGMTDAEVSVAAPSPISGTAALVGAMEAYSKMNGQAIEPDAILGAAKELAVSGRIAEVLGDPDKVAQLVAAVKEIVAKGGIDSVEDIRSAIVDVSGQLDISLSDEEIDGLIDAMESISQMDIDVNVLTEQVKSVYETMKESGLDLTKYGISESQVDSFFGQLSELIQRFLNWLRGIFGGIGG